MYRLNGFWLWTSGAAAAIRMICADVTVSARIGGTVDETLRIDGTADGAVRIGGTPELVEC